MRKDKAAERSLIAKQKREIAQLKEQLKASEKMAFNMSKLADLAQTELKLSKHSIITEAKLLVEQIQNTAIWKDSLRRIKLSGYPFREEDRGRPKLRLQVSGPASCNTHELINTIQELDYLYVDYRRYPGAWDDGGVGHVLVMRFQDEQVYSSYRIDPALCNPEFLQHCFHQMMEHDGGKLKKAIQGDR